MQLISTNPLLIAVDGENNSGKGTALRRIKQYLHQHRHPCLVVSSGSVYRAATRLALLAEPDIPMVRQLNEQELLEIVTRAMLELRGEEAYSHGRAIPFYELDTAEVRAAIPYVSAKPGLRRYVNNLILRDTNAFKGFVILDGRDIGTEVAPQAPLKLYLTVAAAEAARRSGTTVTEVERRNRLDRAKAQGAMKPAADAVIIDTTPFSTDETWRVLYRHMLATFPVLPPLPTAPAA